MLTIKLKRRNITKMKKRKTFLFIINVFLLFICNGCQIFNSNSSTSTNENKIVDTVVEVKDGDYSKKFTIKLNEACIIEYLTKPGHYLKGYYSSELGGTKYFNSIGESESDWKDSYPKILYAQWEPISALPEFNDSKFVEEPKNMGFYSSITSKLSPEWINAVKGNLNHDMTLSVSFRCRNSGNIISSSRMLMDIVDRYGSSGETFASEYIEGINSNYKSFSFVKTIPGKACSKGFINNSIVTYCEGAITIKEYYVTIEFKMDS